MLSPSYDAVPDPGLCTTEARDADEHAHNLSNWRQEYDQVSEGSFYGRIDELTLPQVQLFKEHTSQALRQQCNIWSGGLWFGIPATPVDTQSNRINGQPVEANDILCRPGGCDFELVTTAAFDIFGVVVDWQTLARMAEVQGIVLREASLKQHLRHGLPAQTHSAIRYLLGRLLRADAAATAPHLQQDLVMMAVMELLQKETPNHRVAPSYRHRKDVVDQVKQHLRAHPDAPVTMTGLCELTNVSRRTLQYSFESIVGISPLQFLRLTRLNQVRRALCEARGGQSIADIAAYWGFWHGGQFAKDYKQLFGESPSDAIPL